MEVNSDQVRHDLVNNGIRIEVLNNIVIDSLGTSSVKEQNQIEQLTQALAEHLNILKQL